MTAMTTEVVSISTNGVDSDIPADAATAAPTATVAEFADFRGADVPRLTRPVLSRREVEVLLAWLAADSKEGAAASLFISASTVSTHISRVRAKYAGVGRPAPTKAHLLARAVQDGYTTIAEW